ncbi:ABC transporter permease [Ancylobacter sp. Lp-2]|uniref:ABC transporter permease n=1 Tax=Ancylobacter sp. Lp-2 TaxID=2881339 RepID=UPI001E475825|nr:ABC transporter permease [Ancylobacter sp. Lp-2]MCB4771232.1 ABC transporter permease [Ancylobacter sp. Lp-2]
MEANRLATESAHRLELEAAFLHAQQRRRRWLFLMRLTLNLCGVALFLLLWESVPWLFPTINKVLFPTPSVVFSAFWPMLLSGEIVLNIGVSVRRAATGFVLAAFVGIAAGVFTARSRVADYLTEPLLHGFRSVPVIALVPLSVLWFGIGEGAKIALVATGAFFPIWIATFIGVRDVNLVYLRSAACLGAGKLATMFLVVLPAALPLILAGLRQAMAISLIVLVAAELSGATSGVAYMMSMGHQLFRVDIMFIGLMLLGTLGFVFDRLFVWLTRRLFPWYVN